MHIEPPALCLKELALFEPPQVFFLQRLDLLTHVSVGVAHALEVVAEFAHLLCGLSQHVTRPGARACTPRRRVQRCWLRTA